MSDPKFPPMMVDLSGQTAPQTGTVLMVSAEWQIRATKAEARADALLTALRACLSASKSTAFSTWDGFTDLAIALGEDVLSDLKPPSDMFTATGAKE